MKCGCDYRRMISEYRAWIACAATHALVSPLCLTKVDYLFEPKLLPFATNHINFIKAGLGWWVYPTQAKGGEANRLCINNRC